MYRKRVLIGCLATLATAWLLSAGHAQGQTVPRQEPKPTIMERLDEFGQNLMGGLLPRKNKANETAPPWGDSLLVDEGSPRSGSAVQGQSQSPTGKSSPPTASSGGLVPGPLQNLFTNQRADQPATNPVPPEYYGTPYRSTPVRRDSSGANNTNLSPGEDKSASEDLPASNAARVADAVPRAAANSAIGSASNIAPTPTPAARTAPAAGTTPAAMAPTEQPLHARLQSFRQSVFGNDGADSGASAAGSTAGEPSTRQMPAAQVAETPTPDAAKSTPAPAQQPTLAPRRAVVEGVPTRAPPREQSRAAVEVAQRPAEPPTRAPATPDESHETTPTGVARQDEPTDVATATRRDVEPRATEPLLEARVESPAVADRGDDPVLLTRRSPILNVQTLGPSRIAIGRRSDYEVQMQNLGEVAADDVVVTIALPEWAEVVGAEPTGGAILPDASASRGQQLLWKIGPMEARSRHKVVLGIVPRQSRPIDLAVRWSFTPTVSQAVIVVEEPKLAMRLGGPREVRFGEPQVFKLEIENTGTGDAEDVVLTVMPLVPGQGGPTRHGLGRLAAGGKRAIELELTAGQTGTLDVRMELQCDGPAKASLNETLLVRKASVELLVEAPGMQFTGATATYRVRVRNSGNAAAEKLVISAKIPTEAKLVDADRQGKATADGRAVEWKLDRLAEGEEQVFVVKCSLDREGFTRLKAEASGGSVSAEGTAVTRVESIADLALSVKDPTGPVPVGQTAMYTVHIRNRGTKAASGVEAVIYFSQGIEPVSAEGGRHTIRPGQVVFDGIDVVPAGKEVVLKIAAKAQTPGNHMFRAEIHCRPLGTKLVGEESTYFYRSDLEPSSPRTMIADTPPRTTEADETAETADRRNLPEGTPAPTDAPPVQVPSAGRY